MTMVSNRAFINIKTQFDNVGDALIIRELIRLASERASVEVYLGRAPEAFTNMLELAKLPAVTPHSKGGFLTVVGQMLRARMRGENVHYFLIPGGLNGERSFKQTLFGIVSILVLLFLKIVGIKVSQVGVSFERIGKKHAFLLRWRSKIINATAVRDDYTERYGRDRLGIRITDRAPDLALNLFGETGKVVKTPRNDVAFSFRTDKNPQTAERVVDLAMRVAAMTPQDTKLSFVAQVGRDMAFASELRDMIEAKYPGRTKALDASSSITAATDAYKGVSVLFSNRLHALILGLKAGATASAVIDNTLDIKIKGVFEDIDLGDRIFDISNLTDAEIAKALREERSLDFTKKAYELGAYFDKLFGTAPAKDTD